MCGFDWITNNEVILYSRLSFIANFCSNLFTPTLYGIEIYLLYTWRFWKFLLLFSSFFFFLFFFPSSPPLSFSYTSSSFPSLLLLFLVLRLLSLSSSFLFFFFFPSSPLSFSSFSSFFSPPPPSPSPLSSSSSSSFPPLLFLILLSSLLLLHLLTPTPSTLIPTTPFLFLFYCFLHPKFICIHLFLYSFIYCLLKYFIYLSNHLLFH